MSSGSLHSKYLLKFDTVLDLIQRMKKIFNLKTRVFLVKVVNRSYCGVNVMRIRNANFLHLIGSCCILLTTV